MSGSSPLARGLHVEGQARPVGLGIIPARAGFTSVAAWACEAGGGSSPLARGLQKVVHSNGLGIRIIPARAGFTEQ